MVGRSCKAWSAIGTVRIDQVAIAAGNEGEIRAAELAIAGLAGMELQAAGAGNHRRIWRCSIAGGDIEGELQHLVDGLGRPRRIWRC